MRAVWWTAAGPPEVLVPGEAPDPQPGPGEVLIRVEVAGITFVETRIRAGLSPRPGLTPPDILGNGVGGTVVARGAPAEPRPAAGRPEDGGEWVGRRVVSSTGGRGGYAELAVARIDDLIPVPPALRLTDAVALLADGRTALGLFRLVRPGPSDTVLVEAAGGGVGSLLVQLCHTAGARVIAAASTSDKRAAAMSSGADVALDYTRAGWTDDLRAAAPGGLSVAFDGVGGAIGRAALDTMAPGGRFVLHGVAGGTMTDTSGAAERGVDIFGLDRLATIAASARDLSAAALEEAAAGRLAPVVGQRYPLAHAAQAHAAIEQRRSVGKTLLLA